MASKMVTDREKNSTDVETAIKEHGADVDQGLELVFAPVLEEGETIPQVGLQALVGRLLTQNRERLVAVDEAHVTEITDDRYFRLRRDRAVAELYDKMRQLRLTYEGLYGPERLDQLFGDTRRIPTDPVVLRRLGERVVGKLSAGDPEEPVALLRGVEVRPEQLAEDLRPALGELQESLLELNHERRGSDRSLREKRDAFGLFDGTFGRCARFLEAMWELAGQEFLADRLRSPSRRPRGEPEGEDDAGDGSGNGDGGPGGDGQGDGSGDGDGGPGSGDGSGDGTGDGSGDDGSGDDEGGGGEGGDDGPPVSFPPAVATVPTATVPG